MDLCLLYISAWGKIDQKHDSKFNFTFKYEYVCNKNKRAKLLTSINSQFDIPNKAKHSACKTSVSVLLVYEYEWTLQI